MNPRNQSCLPLASLSGLILIASSAVPLSAATWDGGGGDGNWSTGTNWSTNAVPTGTEAALVNTSVTVNHTSASAFTTSGILVIGGAAAVTSVVNVGPGSGTLQFGGDGFTNAARIGDAAGNGTLNISGGKVQVGTGLAGNDASINLATFSGTGTTGSINVSGGELQVGRRILIAANDASRVGNITLSGTGIIRMVATGSAAEGDLGMIRLGGGTSTLNFDGGELIGRGIRQDAATSASKIYYNGTKFTLNNNSLTGVSALIGSGGSAVNQIKNGGLKIDTASFNATIARGLANFTGHAGVLTKEGAGTLFFAVGGSTYSQTVVNGGVIDLTVSDVFGTHSGSAHELTINAGGRVTNGTAINNGFNTLKTLALDGGELRVTGTARALVDGALFKFEAYAIRDTVTVTGSAASSITNPGAITNAGINIGGFNDLGSGVGSALTFNVTDVTNSSAADLTVSAVLKNNYSNVGFAPLSNGLTKTGGGTMVLSAINTYTGATTITTGTLQVDGSTATGSTVGIGTAGTLTGSGTINGNATLTGSGIINKSAGTIAGTLGVTGGNWNGAGTVTGAVTSSSGTFTIGSGANLTATTGVSATGGAMVVNGTLTGTLNTNSSTTLSGTGTITGNTTLQGIHNPGNSPGIQTFGGNLAYSGGASVVNWELTNDTITNLANPNAIFDQIIVGGNLDFTSLTTINLIFNGAGSGVAWGDALWTTDQSWTLFDVTGTTSNFGNLNLTAINWLDGSGNLFDTLHPNGDFSLSQSGNNVLINYTAVPEPNVAALLGGIGVFALLRRRRN